jgi:16S rRNA (cytidine1402-2'-O)-methyltransferase
MNCGHRLLAAPIILMSGTLYVVATPIGNLEDITLRALRILREADLIAAEDTRRTAGLLAHHGIATPTLSFHEHNSRTRLPQLLARLQNGARVALVTDAGLPGVSDPGVELVRGCVESGIAVDAIPGPTATLTAAVASGFPLDPVTLYGFPPNRSIARSGWLGRVAKTAGTFTFFEAPHRIIATLVEAQVFLGERQICLGRELTKVHQEYLRGSIPEVLAQLSEPKGEFTIVVGPASAPNQEEFDVSDSVVAKEFGDLTEKKGFRRRDAIAEVARKFGRSTREVYAAVERVKHASE